MVTGIVLAACPPAETANPVESINIANAATPMILGGATRQLAANVLPAGGGADRSAVTWSSANEAVATITDAGVVTAVSVGTSVITATSTYTPGVYGTATITVNLPAASAVVISGFPTGVGVGTALDPIRLMNYATDFNLTAVVNPQGEHMNQAVNWSVVSGDSLTVAANGTVSVEDDELGVTVIRATSVQTPGQFSELHFEVFAAATAVAMAPSTLTLFIGSETTLTASALPGELFAPDAVLNWSIYPARDYIEVTPSATDSFIANVVIDDDAPLTLQTFTVTASLQGDSTIYGEATIYFEGIQPQGAIATIADWVALTEIYDREIAGDFFLVNDLDFAGHDPINSIGYNGAHGDFAFDGTMDGRGHTISNMRIALSPHPSNATNTTTWLASVFGGTTANAEIRNLAIYNVSFGHAGTPDAIGLLVGHNRGLVENVFLDGTVTGGGYAAHARNGLLFGRNGTTGLDNPAQDSAIWRNVVVNVRGTPSANLIGGQMNSGAVDNVFVQTVLPTDGAQVWPDGGYDTDDNTVFLSNITIFAPEDIGTVDFSSLSGDFWTGRVVTGATALPSLVDLTATSNVVFRPESGEGYRFVGGAFVEEDEDYYEFSVVVSGRTHVGAPVVTYTVGYEGSNRTPVLQGSAPAESFGYRTFTFRIDTTNLEDAIFIFIDSNNIVRRPHVAVTVHADFTLEHGVSGDAFHDTQAAEWRTWDGTTNGATFRAAAPPAFAVNNTVTGALDFTFAIRVTHANGFFNEGITRESLVLTVTIGGVEHTFRVEASQEFITGPVMTGPGASNPPRDYRFRIPANLITGDIVFMSLDFAPPAPAVTP